MNLRPIALLSLLCAAAISGCSIFPYEEDFACKLKDNLGKCQDVTAAYDEAVTGVATAPPMKKASEQSHNNNERDPDTLQTDHAMSASSGESKLPTQSNQSGYAGYRQAVYSKLQQYVEAPQTPMISPPRSVRTMILPYSSTNNKNRLYMPRYVMSIVNEPKFVIGEYLYKRPEMYESIIDKAKQEQKQ